MEVPNDPELQQFISREEYEDMGATFKHLADSGKSMTRLPTKPFDRQKVISAFQEAFDLIGGVPRLAIWAHHNTGDFYKLYGKLIPSANMIDMVKDVNVTINAALPRSRLDGSSTQPSPAQHAVEHQQIPSQGQVVNLPTPARKIGSSTF